MYYPDEKEYITFLFSLLDEFAERKQTLISRGRPKTYSDASLIVFYAMMTLKQINTIRGQHRWLYTHPMMLEMLRLPFSPSRSTLARRYKVPCCHFSVSFASSSRIGEFSRDMVFHTPSSMKIRVCSKHEVPSGTRRIVRKTIFPKDFAMSIRPQTGQKVETITDGSMDMDFI